MYARKLVLLRIPVFHNVAGKRPSFHSMAAVRRYLRTASTMKREEAIFFLPSRVVPPKYKGGDVRNHVIGKGGAPRLPRTTPFLVG